MLYEHTQRAALHYIFYPVIIALLVLTWAGRDRPAIVLVTLGVAATLILVAMMFQRLTVRDEGERLALRYGPVPVFRKLIHYSDITSVEPGRSSVIDGWGIHWIPGRGFTYNIWGLDCAKLVVQGRIVRVGSDDVEDLVAFLRGKIGDRQAAEEAQSESDRSGNTA
jgi:hypothetical protein